MNEENFMSGKVMAIVGVWAFFLASCSQPMGLPRPRVLLTGPPLGAASDEGSWRLLGRGELAEVYVQRTLYRLGADGNYLLRFRGRNISESPIGLALGRYEDAIRPSLWAAAPGSVPLETKPSLRMRMLGPLERASIVEQCASCQLMTIPLGGSVDYFCQDERAMLTGADIADGNRVVVTLDGNLTAVTGQAVDRFITPPSLPSHTLVLPADAAAQNVPRGSVLITRQGTTIYRG
jgi:hypothetical protein